MTGPARQLTAHEWELVSRVFGFGCVRDMVAAVVKPRRSAVGLPSATAILAACSQVIVAGADGEILSAIRELAALAERNHYAREDETRSAAELAVTHHQLLASIDRFTRERVADRARRAAVVHTESLAAVIDRLVLFAVTRTVIAPSTFVAAELDTALTDLMAGYDQLVDELLTGRRRLPRYQTVPAS
ncbi:hypothetical protein D5S18_08205 [Nocardia panacis]|uniref:DUF4254 domain-containing protein n=1 Tax=Nocardia panacis TaxID=2340916 RepID=A0A3A4K0T8_9NOCA|nr:hypothetical protein [Nocardia panacis]RJO77703.1 hypothetical protein D5S18_08205 [Nocardia panacis]